MREGGGEKSGGAHKFSLLLLQNTISPNWRENWSKKWKKYLDKTAPTSFSISGFFFSSFDFSFVMLLFLCFCFLFFLSLVLLGGGFFFFSFFLFFIFYYFFKKTLLDDFLCYFLKCPLSSIHNLKKNYNALFFVLFKRDMMVNLYKLYFHQNKKVFHSSTFSPSQPNTNEEN